MDFTTLQDRVKFVLDNNDGQTNQAFTTARIKQALNWVYRQEINDAQLEGSRMWFLTTKDKTWAASAVTFELPDGLDQHGLIRVSDVTSTSPGDDLVFDEKGVAGELFWKNRSTLQWGTSGPSSAKTLRFTYYAVPSEMVEDDDVPELIPERYHELLIWSAAVLLLDIADQKSPFAWIKNRDDMRMGLYKFLSRGRPMSEPPRVLQADHDSDDGLIY